MVSDGNPFRRLLDGSNKNSFFTAVSPLKWIARHIRKGKPCKYSTLRVFLFTLHALKLPAQAINVGEQSVASKFQACE